MHSGRFFFFCSWYIYEISVQRLCKRLNDWCHNAFINWLILSVFVCVCAPRASNTHKNAYITWKSTHNAVDAVLWAVCKGWLDKVTPALQVVIIRYLLGISTKVTTVWIVPSGSRCSILDFILAVVVTLGRCERCWSGALSRNSHRGSINLWCPADKRPTDRLGAVTLAIFPEWLFSCSWVNICQTPLTHSWVRLSTTSHPRRAVNRWATTQCPLRLTAMQLWVGCVSTLRTLRVSRVGVWH